mgnify:CR=1 FL=1
MKTLKHLATLCTALLLTTAAFGQTARMHLNGTLQNMHLWRGQQVADGGVLAADLNVGLLDDKLKVGLWGGTDFTGDYKEFDYYVSYSVAGFTVAVWDIFNYSPALTFSKDIFNYNKHSTGHFLDLSVAYDFDTKFEVPLRLYWATIFAGRDLTIDGDNRYSTYVNAEYSVFRDEHRGCRSGRHVCLHPRRSRRRRKFLRLRRHRPDFAAGDLQAEAGTLRHAGLRPCDVESRSAGRIPAGGGQSLCILIIFAGA